MGKLEDEYRVRLLDTDPLDHTATGWVWLWYVKARYAADLLPVAYELCQRDPKDAAARNIVAYIKEELTDKELFLAMRAETGDAYAANLVALGILPADITKDAAYLALTEEIAMEGIKACRPLRGCDPTQLDKCAAAETVALWLHFVDRLHDMVRKPRVRELLEVMHPQSPEEKELLDADDFTTYELTEKEREDLKEDLELTIAGAGGGLDLPRLR